MTDMRKSSSLAHGRVGGLLLNEKVGGSASFLCILQTRVRVVEKPVPGAQLLGSSAQLTERQRHEKADSAPCIWREGLSLFCRLDEHWNDLRDHVVH